VTDLRSVVTSNNSVNDITEKDEETEKEVPSIQAEAADDEGEVDIWKSVVDQAVRQQQNVNKTITTNETYSVKQQPFTSPKPPSVPNVPPRHVPEDPPPKAPPRSLAQPPSVPPRQHHATGSSTPKSPEDELKAALAKRYASDS
jgi:hypothetical protein